MISHDIICLSETWHEKVIKSNSLFSSYDIVAVSAVRIHKQGRAKGGLITLFKRDRFKLHSIIAESSNILILRLSNKIEQKHIVIGNFYIPPGTHSDKLITDAFVLLDNSIALDPDIGIILGGDFNARVGDMTNIFDELETFELQQRKSKDAVVTPRGNNLMDLMTELDLMLINGCTKDDEFGEFTYNSTSGSSVIDLIFVNPLMLALLEHFSVGFLPHSHHSPTIIKWNGITSTAQILPPPLHLTVFNWKNETATYANHICSELEKHENVSYELLMDIITQAARVSGQAFDTTEPCKNIKQTWFNSDCREANKTTKQKAKLARYYNWSSPFKEEFIDARKFFKNLCRTRKREYWKSLKETLSQTTNQQDFWSRIKPFKSIQRHPIIVEENEWKIFYEKLMPPRLYDNTPFYDARHPTLDSNITTWEVEHAIKKLKLKKSPGPDGLKNEFIKNLPQIGIEKIANCFSNILEKEIPPKSWSESITVMLFKKGDPHDPINYRPIALLNSLMKLFTQIINQRLTTWAEQSNILPESQGGFRKGRGCEDLIFTLNTAIQLGTRGKANKVFVLFIDFSRCFPSITHNKLWAKLHSIGVSGKLIRFLRNLYEVLSTQIRLENSFTDPIPMTEGLAQGDVLSPLLYALYVCDMEKVLIDLDASGIEIDPNLTLHVLQYADDTGVMSPSRRGLQAKINRLSNYYDVHELEVNLGKTKVVIFRRGGRISPTTKFTFKNQQIEIVPSYTYLGVPFHSSGCFRNTSNAFKTKGLKTLGVIWPIMINCTMEPIKQKFTLFNAMTLASVLYCSHIWGLRYLEEIEKVQNAFLRKMLGLSRFSAAYVNRLESGKTSLKSKVAKQAITFILKLKHQAMNRYPRRCFTRLLELSRNVGENERYNWVTQIKHLIGTECVELIWNNEDAESTLNCWSEAIDNIKRTSHDSDIQRCSVSDTYYYYQDCNPQMDTPTKYLTLPIPFRVLKIIAQFRAGNGNFYINTNLNVKIKYNEICSICNRNEINSLLHILTKCPLNIGPRTKFFINDKKIPALMKDLMNVLNPKTKEDAISLYNFLIECLTNIIDVPSFTDSDSDGDI